MLKMSFFSSQHHPLDIAQGTDNESQNYRARSSEHVMENGYCAVARTFKGRLFY